MELNDDFIVGIGLSGDETSHPAALFKEAFQLAEQNGLKRTVHAGEAVGPESVWDAIRVLNANRIDHGTRAREDATLVRYLKESKIALTQCITSNLRLGVVRGIDDHPFRDYYDDGLVVTLNTDDPEVFHTSLTREYFLTAKYFGFCVADLEEIMLNGMRASFLPDNLKEHKLNAIKAEIASLRKEFRM